MSKLWLLLLVVAAIHAAQSFPTNDDYLEDPETTADILKETWGKLKDKFKQMSKEKKEQAYKYLRTKLCKNVQSDFEEDFDEEEDEAKPMDKIFAKLREILIKLKTAVKEEKAKLVAEFKRLQAKFCNLKQEDYAEDEGDEERGFGKWAKKGSSAGKKATTTANKAGKMSGWLDKAKKKMKKLKAKASAAMKKGREFLKNAGFKVEILKCVEKTCSSCLSFMNKKMCMDMRFMRTNKATSVVLTFKVLEKVLKEVRINFGDVPNCFSCGDFVGKVCAKLIEGRVKTSQGSPKFNFCMGVLAENFGVGVKLCATYEDKKLKFKFSPKMFAGAMTEDGEMVEMGSESGNEVEGVVLDADEFELDE